MVQKYLVKTQVNEKKCKKHQKYIKITFQSKSWLRFDDKPGCSALPVDQNFLHPVLLSLQFSQGREFAQPAKGQYKLVPVGIFLPDLFANSEKSVSGNLQSFVAVISSQPLMLQTLVSIQTFFFGFDQKFTNEIFTLFTDIDKGFFIKLPTGN